MEIGIWRSAGIAMLLAFAAPVAKAAPTTTAEKCLAASYYPDGQELYELCTEAIKDTSLDAKTRANANLQLGQAIYFSHRPGVAVPYLTEAIKLDPTLDQAYRRRGWANLMAGQAGEAHADLTEFLARQPDDPDALFAMAFARRWMGETCAETIQAYETILKLYPDHHITRNAIAGEYRCNDGNNARAIAAYDRIVAAGRETVAGIAYYGRKNTDDYDFYAFVRLSRGEALVRAGRNVDAMSDASWLIAAYPEHPGGYVVRSNVRQTEKDGMAALADAEKALELAPGYHEAITSKLRALRTLKRHEDIVAYATGVMSGAFQPRNGPDYLFARGIAHYRLGHRGDALGDIYNAMAANENFAWDMATQLRQSGYLFGSRQDAGNYPDILSKEFKHAMLACMIDPECVK